MGSRWRITANLGYKVWIERGEEAEEGQESGGVTMEVSIDPLDPIQRGLVCGAKVTKMMKKLEALELKVLHRAVRLLCCEEEDAPDWYKALKEEPETERKVSIRFMRADRRTVLGVNDAYPAGRLALPDPVAV